MKTQNVQQAPVRNESVVGAQVYSHSGEFSPQIIDLAVPGRGVSFQFIRKYRSALCQEKGPLGRGWTFTYTYAKRIERDDDDIFYHDGEGRTHRFIREPQKNHYRSNELYAVLIVEDERIILKQQYGTVFIFDDDGRLLAIEDRNGNALKFKHTIDTLSITDPLSHQITLTLDDDRIVQVRDHADRVWQYKYNEDECLIEVIQPPTADFPHGTSIKYGYDKAFRLISITDPKGQTFLHNSYDDQGRVIRQDHGSGFFEFQYETIGKTKTGFPIYRTQVRQKNGALLTLEHDADGHVVEQILLVSAGSLSPEDRGGATNGMVPLTTRSKFNPHGELIEQVLPTGIITEWIYDDNNEDPRALGNLLQMTKKAAPNVESDQKQILTKYTYEPQYQQQLSVTDPRGHTTNFKYDDRGNLTQKIYPSVTIQQVNTDPAGGHPTRVKQLVEKFEYNVSGQLIRSTDTRGVITEHDYYPADDPTGAEGQKGAHSDKGGGYLARVVVDPAGADHHLPSKPANLVKEYSYDVKGNVTAIRDGKGNATSLNYDTQNMIISVTSCAPFNYQKSIRRDANGNPVKSTLSFDHFEYDPVKGTVVEKSSTISQTLEYNVLNNVTRRTITADGKDIIDTTIRDANENIVRTVQPLGNVTEYDYDERNLLLQQRLGVGTEDQTAVHYTYTLLGQRRSITDGLGNTTHYDYDGFHRYRGLTNAGGTTRKQRYDAMDNVTEIEVTGDVASVNVGTPQILSLLHTWQYYDELNRRIRTNRAWLDPTTGKPLGQSRWDGQQGVVSTVVEYDDNNHPAKVWDESGNIQSREYDGANRVVASSDATGESVSIEYDENSNPIRLERLGPQMNQGEERFHQLIVQQFDALDRLISRTVNAEPQETWVYNALGNVTTYTNQAKVVTQFLHDPFTRRAGQATIAITPPLNGGQSKQTLIQRVEWDDNSRIVARINAAGHRMQYIYDALNRRSAVNYPNGNTKDFERDGNGNAVRILDPNLNVIVNKFDALNRLVERRIEQPNGGEPQIEQYHYDGLNRIVTAITSAASTRRRYDSLSRLLTENQSGRTIGCEYDSAGNLTYITYPGGQKVHLVYDVLNRVSEVRDGENDLIAQYTYRSRRQRKQLKLGNLLEANYSYNPSKNRLEEVKYQAVKGGEVLEGSRYLYDAVGNPLQETQLHYGEACGERYSYDSANRLVKVQYDVHNLDDPNSQFRQEVQYELSPVATWQKKTILDATGQMVTQVEGVTDEQDAYLSYGNCRFENDANGNRTLETNGDGVQKRYTYDYANRPIQVECLAANGNVIQTIEYNYDAFNRQVLKRVKDANGTREIARTWNSSQLIEEWENGKLARNFVYGARVGEPVKMNRFLSGATDEFFYTLNGRGLVTMLMSPGGVVERYRYDIFGQPFLSEIKDKPSPGEEQPSSSFLGNPFFAGGRIWDSDAGLHFTAGRAL